MTHEINKLHKDIFYLKMHMPACEFRLAANVKLVNKTFLAI